MLNSVSKAHLGWVLLHKPVCIGCWHIWWKIQCSEREPKYASRCHLKYLLLVIAHILAVLKSHESVLVSLASPVMKGDALASFLVIAPPWDLTTTWSSINIKVAHFLTSIIIHQTLIFTFVSWEKVVCVSVTASIGESSAWLRLLVKEPSFIVSSAESFDPRYDFLIFCLEWLKLTFEGSIWQIQAGLHSCHGILSRL